MATIGENLEVPIVNVANVVPAIGENKEDPVVDQKEIVVVTPGEHLKAPIELVELVVEKIEASLAIYGVALIVVDNVD